MDTKTVNVILYVRDFELVIHLQQIYTVNSYLTDCMESNSPCSLIASIIRGTITVTKIYFIDQYVQYI